MLKLPGPFPFLSIVSVSVRLQTSRRAQLDILIECNIESGLPWWLSTTENWPAMQETQV